MGVSLVGNFEIPAYSSLQCVPEDADLHVSK